MSRLLALSFIFIAIIFQLHNLKSRTSVETLLYATRRSTDLPLRAVAFATDGVVDFMGSVMRIDEQDLTGKMEGFAVRGIQGMCV